MVVLSAQDSDRHINQIAPDFFNDFPDMKALAKADSESIFTHINKVRNFGNKTKWLLELASTIKEDKNIPATLEGLTDLPGIGRKSANVIMREIGVKAEGIIVDLHVVRVASNFKLLNRPNADWQAALELTEMLRSFDPKDPCKYDFALFGLGVLEKF